MTWKEQLYAEPLEPRKYTEKEAFEAGKRGDMSNYDVAGRKCARLIIDAAKKNCKVGYVLGKMKDIGKNLDRYASTLSKDDSFQVWQLWFMDIESWLDNILRSETPEIMAQVDLVGPTGFMWGWAVQAAYGYLKEEGLTDARYGWPKVGHAVKEGTCPRCRIPIQKEWNLERRES